MAIFSIFEIRLSTSPQSDSMNNSWLVTSIASLDIWYYQTHRKGVRTAETSTIKPAHSKYVAA